LHCPFCRHSETRVIDSRATSDGLQIRRRRECIRCEARFSTLESPALRAPNVIKQDGSREAFDEDKLRRGIHKALEKRPVETAVAERAIRSLIQHIRMLDQAEIPSQRIGEFVMRTLARLDQVAYVRFASVYRRFEDVNAFVEEIRRLQREDPGALDIHQISLLDQGLGDDDERQ